MVGPGMPEAKRLRSADADGQAALLLTAALTLARLIALFRTPLELGGLADPLAGATPADQRTLDMFVGEGFRPQPRDPKTGYPTPEWRPGNAVSPSPTP
jgi:hypothetical protein